MLDATPFQVAGARRGLNVAMISNLKRTRRLAAILCTLLWLLLCPGLRFVSHSHDEFTEADSARSSLDWHLQAFHDASNDSVDPQNLHFHWLFELPGAMHLGCCSHPGLDVDAAHTSHGFGTPEAGYADAEHACGNSALVVWDDASRTLLPCVANGNTGPSCMLESHLDRHSCGSIHAGWSPRTRLQSLLCILQI
jgi:hypothetical protein